MVEPPLRKSIVLVWIEGQNVEKDAFSNVSILKVP